MRLLTRPAGEIRAVAERLAAALAPALPGCDVAVAECRSQIGSGALPVDLLASFAVTIEGADLDGIARWLRGLTRPVIGRVGQRRVWLDCRCLEPEGLRTLSDDLRAARRRRTALLASAAPVP